MKSRNVFSVLLMTSLFLIVSAAGEAQSNETKTPPNDPSLPKVLIIGDSISIGYTEPVTRLLKGQAIVQRVPENCQSTVYALAHIKTWLGGEHWEVIHFNWGIWDIHHLDAGRIAVGGHIRTTPEQYRKNLVMLLGFLKATQAKLIWATTTPVKQPFDRSHELNAVDEEDVPVYNQVALQIMQENNVQVDDLYQAVLPRVREYWQVDNIHYEPAGNEFLGQQVVKSIRVALAEVSR